MHIDVIRQQHHRSTAAVLEFKCQHRKPRQNHAVSCQHPPALISPGSDYYPFTLGGGIKRYDRIAAVLYMPPEGPNPAGDNDKFQ